MSEIKKSVDESCSVKFLQLCEFLESLNQQRHKKQLLHEFFIKNNSTIKNFYPIVRLMLPTFDTERTAYGYKEKKLGKLYSQMLSLPHDLAIALQDFKKPHPLIANFPSGEFTSALEFVLKPRLPTPGSQLRVDQINQYLDQLADMSQQNRDELFKELLKKMNVMEHKWFCRIILRKMQIGTEHNILRAYHDDAEYLYNHVSSLREVVTTLRPGQKSNLGTKIFRLHMPIKPMLASRRDNKYFLQRPDNQYFVETKYDGERMQMHLSRFEEGCRLSFFTRNASDFTSLYGEKLLTVIQQSLKQEIQSIILDGEMLCWDQSTQNYLPFGQNRTVALASDEENQAQGV